MRYLLLVLLLGGCATKVSTLGTYDRGSWPHWIDLAVHPLQNPHQNQLFFVDYPFGLRLMVFPNE